MKIAGTLKTLELALAMGSKGKGKFFQKRLITSNGSETIRGLGILCRGKVSVCVLTHIQRLFNTLKEAKLQYISRIDSAKLSARSDKLSLVIPAIVKRGSVEQHRLSTPQSKITMLAPACICKVQTSPLFF